MEHTMTGAERRKKILELMKASSKPLSGVALGNATGVSRQVVVQDIALLRTEGYSIVSTARGYLLDEPIFPVRTIKVCHTEDRTEEELTAIVDLGGCVLDVMINHRIYGKMSAPLNIVSRLHIDQFIEGVRSGKSVELMSITGGFHYHTVRAESEQILDNIEHALSAKNYIAPII